MFVEYMKLPLKLDDLLLLFPILFPFRVRGGGYATFEDVRTLSLINQPEAKFTKIVIVGFHLSR